MDNALYLKFVLTVFLQHEKISRYFCTGCLVLFANPAEKPLIIKEDLNKAPLMLNLF